MTAIRVQDLSKSFKKGTHALRNVNLRVAKGEMVALIGASGAGKSTLIRHLVGLTTGDAGSGQVTVLGDAPVRGHDEVDPQPAPLQHRDRVRRALEGFLDFRHCHGVAPLLTSGSEALHRRYTDFTHR